MTKLDMLRKSFKIIILISVVAGFSACLPLFYALFSFVASFFTFVYNGKLWWSDWSTWCVTNAWWLWTVALGIVLLAFKPVRNISPLREFFAS